MNLLAISRVVRSRSIYKSLSKIFVLFIALDLSSLKEFVFLKDKLASDVQYKIVARPMRSKKTN